MASGTILMNTYQVGDCLGKGAFGAVYRCINIETGECIAIKQIKLTNIPKSELNVIMTEIDLLRKLNHANIVKYVGSFKTKEDLNIMLEFCENGSLASICKKFGRFPENLVGVYICQVLQGLDYLHNQGVIHRDVKGANILTTKDGQVKLADFGVATRLGDQEENAVVGSPYWMAPEVIELCGSHAVSDIWSVGCTTIELIQGSPPYYNLSPMQALFRIVQDEHPPLPDGISGSLKDFLMQCFQKDVNLRVNASKLLKHPWIQTCRTKFQKSNRRESDTNPKQEFMLKSVKEYNQAIETSNYRRGSNISEDSKNSKKLPHEDADDENWDDDFVLDDKDSRFFETNSMVKVTEKPKLDAKLNQKASKKITITPEKDSDNWDSDFEFADSPGLIIEPNVKISSESNLRTETINVDVTDDDDYTSAFLVDSSAAEMKLKNDEIKTIDQEAESAEFSDDDPFQSFDNELEEIDIEESIRLDYRAKLLTEVEELMKMLIPDNVGVDENCKRLLIILSESPSLRNQFIKIHGVLILIEMVEKFKAHSSLKSVLQVLNQFMFEFGEIQENLCLMGGLPTILNLSKESYAKEVRIEIGKFIQQLCRTSNTTLQMFISCRGLNVLVDLLDTDYESGYEIIWLAVEGISSVFELQGVTSKNDFCKLLAKHNLIPKLMKTLKNCAHDTNPLAFEIVSKIINICNILSNSESSVRVFMSRRYVISHMIDLIDKLPPMLILNCIKCFRNLSNSPTTLEALEKANLIERLIELLQKRNEPFINEIYNQVLIALFNLCRLSKRRQEIAASHGAIPHLMYFVTINSPLKQFALPILCDFAHSGKKCRLELASHDGLEFYLDLLGDKYWQVNALESINSWLNEDTEYVEGILIQEDSISRIIDAFSSNKNNFETLLDPLLKIIAYSPNMSKAFSQQNDLIIHKIIERFSHPKALVRLNLIKILSRLVDYSADVRELERKFSLKEVLKKVCNQDDAVLVQEISKYMIGKI